MSPFNYIWKEALKVILQKKKFSEVNFSYCVEAFEEQTGS